MPRKTDEKLTSERRDVIHPETDERPYWKIDRDLTNRMSNEASAGRQPVADRYSPVADFQGVGPAEPKNDD